ncbi:MAG: DUF302 domain-containing protein [Sulfurimonadaceae bacterium]|jgi:hypothetical protein|nr:DUF302 domain-containing protein [Sulfurimonadaceae bacterium]
MIRKIGIGISTAAIAVMFSGCTMIKMGTTFMGFSSETQDAYANMMGVIGETGDPAQAMMLEFPVNADIDEDEMFEEMKDIAEEFNMMKVGEKNMFRIESDDPNVIVHARIAEFCSLGVAKKMFNHSRYYGGFMPCRVVMVEYGDGRRYLITMDMTLALYGGTDKKPIDPDLFEDMINVKKAMEAIPARAAIGE